MIVYFILSQSLFISLFLYLFVETVQFRSQIAKGVIEASGDSWVTTVSDDRIYKHG